MFDHHRAPRHEASSPITFRLSGGEWEGTLVNLSASGALFRFESSLPLGPETVGETVEFTSWYDVGALIRPRGRAVRFFEEPTGKHLAIRYVLEDLPD